MQRMIDMKTLGLGLILGLIVAFSLGPTRDDDRNDDHNRRDFNRPIGRYQIAAGNDIAFMVDTATGKAWASRAGDRKMPEFWDEKR